LWGDGDHPLPFVLVSDTADALFLARDAQGIIGHALNIIGPPLLTGSEYVAAVAQAAHIAIDVRPKSPALFYAGDMAKWAVKVAVHHPGRQKPCYRDWKSRTQRAEFTSLDTQRLLSWSPTTDRQHLIDEGVTRAVIDWFA
jgi:nucleoside-diphosphate-sugar epimerase